MNEQEIRQLAERHWMWVEPLLLPHYDQIAITTMKYLYTTAMIHGYKHRKKEEQNGTAS